MYYNRDMIKFVDFKKHVASGAFAPVYAFSGDDEFLVKSALSMLKKRIDMPELNISVFGDGAAVEAMTAAYSQLPMMSEYRLMIFVVENRSAGEIKRFLEHVRKYPNPATIVACDLSGAPPAIAASFENSEFVDCKRLDKPMVIKWIASNATARGIRISTAAAELLTDYCLGNLTRIDVELDKLAEAGEGMIEEERVREFVTPDGDYKIYELSDALAKKNTDRTYLIYDSLIVSTPPVVIIGALYSHFRRLLYAATGKFDRDTLARFLRVKPYAMEMAMRQAKMYTPVKLKKTVDKLSEIDFAFKSGQTNDRLALDSFIAEMLCAATA